MVAIGLTILLAARPAWHTRALVLAANGAGIVLVALTGRHDGASVARHLIHTKVGTGEVVNPTSTYTTDYGWWITLAGGLVTATAAACWYLRASRSRRTPKPAEGSHAHPTPVG